MIARLLAILLCWGLAGTAPATPEFPPLGGRVVDQAGLLQPDQVNHLTQALAAHEAATSNQVVVATLPDLQGLTIEDYGYQLGRHWGIGQQGKDNGVLLLVAPNERKVRIEVGYGLEGTLTDALASGIVQQRILPRFREGQMAQGIVDGAQAILAVLQQDPDTLAALQAPNLSDAADQGVPAMIFALAALQFARIFLRKLTYVLGASLVAVPLFWWLTGSLLMAGGLWVVLAVLLLATSASGGGGGGGGGYRSSSRGGGGFSGGGGSFGGGGASGSW